MWQALGVLQDGLSRSASNAQFKLLLLLLYCHLGAFEPVVDLYYNLDAKHVQHDTIGSVRPAARRRLSILELQLSSSRGQTGVFFSRCSFLLTRYAESLGHFAAASQSCNFSLRFFHSNQKDVRQQHLFQRQRSEPVLTDLPVSSSRQTSEYIIQAYKYGAFEKIPEFIALRNRLNHSLHFAQVRTERMLLDLFLEADM